MIYQEDLVVNQSRMGISWKSCGTSWDMTFGNSTQPWKPFSGTSNLMVIFDRQTMTNPMVAGLHPTEDRLSWSTQKVSHLCTSRLSNHMQRSLKPENKSIFKIESNPIIPTFRTFGSRHVIWTCMNCSQSNPWGAACISGAPFLHQSPSYLQLKGRHLAENCPQQWKPWPMNVDDLLIKKRVCSIAMLVYWLEKGMQQAASRVH